jgi:hypothetical protein
MLTAGADVRPRHIDTPVRSLSGRCLGFGRIDGMHIDSPGAHLGAHNSISCPACAGRGYTEYSVPDPVPRGGGKQVGGKQAGVGQGGGGGGGEQAVGRPWFPEVDEWFEEKVPVEVRRWVAFASAIVLASFAGWHASEAGFTGTEVWGAAAAGGVAGLILLPVLVMVVKLVMLGLMLAAIGVVGWVIYNIVTAA